MQERRAHKGYLMQQGYTSRFLNYLLYLPDDQPAEGLPLIVFLHGSGERGSDLSLVKRYALPALLENDSNFPAAVLSPQCPLETRWTDHAPAVLALIDAVRQRHNFDPMRLYLTGFSMGGQGVWYIAARAPRLFAAVAPVAARIPPDPHFLAHICDLKDVPIWAIHGSADEVVPCENTRNLATALETCGGKVKVSLLEGADHIQTAIKAFAPSFGLYEWLIAHRL
ncbi:MAG: dienelactone hydrolase family protein [Aggregatilineales bacterium]